MWERNAIKFPVLPLHFISLGGIIEKRAGLPWAAGGRIAVKRLLSLILLLFLLLSLASCEGYTSSYRAVGLIRSNTEDSCLAQFHSLEGRLVFKLRRQAAGEGDISYSVTVEEGELTLYYDTLGTKTELCKVGAGEALTDRGGYVEAKQAVYIILEATGGTRGRVSVKLDP